MTFVALQMYFPWLSPEAGEITKTPSLLLFSGLFSSLSQTTAGGGLPALTTQRKTTVSPPVTVSFFAGMISIFGITWPKRVVINVLTLFLARNLVATLSTGFFVIHDSVHEISTRIRGSYVHQLGNVKSKFNTYPPGTGIYIPASCLCFYVYVCIC